MAILLLVLYAQHLLYSQNYSRFQGYHDYYRMPLEYPFELISFDSLKTMSIGVWQRDMHPLYVDEIHALRKEGHLLLGMSLSPDHSQARSYFIFDCRTGETQVFAARCEWSEALQQHGCAEPPELLTVREYWDSYW